MPEPANCGALVRVRSRLKTLWLCAERNLLRAVFELNNRFLIEVGGAESMSTLPGLIGPDSRSDWTPGGQL